MNKINKYNWQDDPEYLDYLEREKKEAHLRIYDDAQENTEEQAECE